MPWIQKPVSDMRDFPTISQPHLSQQLNRGLGTILLLRRHVEIIDKHNTFLTGRGTVHSLTTPAIDQHGQKFTIRLSNDTIIAVLLSIWKILFKKYAYNHLILRKRVKGYKKYEKLGEVNHSDKYWYSPKKYMNVHGQVREFSSWSVSPVQLGHNDVLGLACAGSRWEIYVDRKIPETYAIIRHKFITALSLLNSDFVLTFKMWSSWPTQLCLWRKSCISQTNWTIEIKCISCLLLTNV